MLQSCFKMTSSNNARRLVYVLANRAYSRKSRRNKEIRGEELLEHEDELVMKIEDSEFRTNPNWQLLPRHKDSQFKLPNNFGIAPEDCIITTRLNYYTQDCPVLLKSEITERFNVPHLKNYNLCMITINLKQTSNTDVSNLTRQYLHAAFGISDRLQNSGYWADFIHPYTGLPALNPGLNIDFSTLELPYKHTVYQVNTRRKCKVIVEKPSINTIGNIFTNALPSKTDLVENILDEVSDLHQNTYD
ncbi:methylmalonic aciduria and homocystinuria type D protein, mitochondrial [Sipha flava]|uniref:Methylmalonic aciduria and homocystinuria type D protein, mitochondrial n=1 Tax=Sipha flava TaxID=143950 RepID=A0A8B8F3Q8_9HEMI|nr:methylmalonic aciduria and homocystinuria type D protein, mitochondrial [Sipha flava]